MSSAISSTGVSMGMFRPDPSQIASNLFSKLDTKGQGYLEKSDLQSAFAQIAGSSGSDTGVDDVFSQLDGNGDGKVTKDEMSSALQKVADALDSQFNQMRLQGGGGMQGPGGMNGMPPPPPPGNDQGFTKDELTSQLQEIGSSDSQRASFISNIVNNFDQADSDGDGKVTFKEARAFNQSSSDSSSTTAASTGTTSSSEASDAQVMKKIMELMQAYGGFGSDMGQSALASLLTTSA